MNKKEMIAEAVDLMKQKISGLEKDYDLFSVKPHWTVEKATSWLDFLQESKLPAIIDILKSLPERSQSADNPTMFCDFLSNSLAESG
ncbi:hypothetical protein D3C71_1376590 [compost metagenome]